MGTPTIVKPEEHFFVNKYEGTGTGQRVGNFVPFTDSGTIDKSVIINHNTAQARLGRTPGSNGNDTTLSFSCWVKRGVTGGTIRQILICNNYSSVGEALEFTTGDQLYYYCIKSSPGSYDWSYQTSRTFEDTSKWYHIMVVRDTTDSTQADRIKIYVDGERVTTWNSTPTQAGSNKTGYWNQTTFENTLGNTNQASIVRGLGYLAEVNMVDGAALTPDTFGQTDTSTGRWVPKTLSGITYGSQGYRLTFANTAGLTIGDDTSGNGNDFTVTNLDGNDVTTDSPTQNHATLHNVIKNTYIQTSEGNLKAAQTGGSQGNSIASNMPLSSGKYYCEITITTAGPTLFLIGVGKESDYRDHYTQDNPLQKIEGAYIRSDTGQGYTTVGDVGTYSPGTYGSSFTTNDVIGFAIDADKGAVWFSKNGTWMNSATASEIANSDVSKALRFGMPGPLVPLQYTHNGTTLTYNFGQKTFAYTPPTGYNAMQQDNLPETGKGIPDLFWVKNRDATDHPQLYDSSRGVRKNLQSSQMSISQDIPDGVQKFLKGGVSIEDDASINSVNESYICWNWVANGGTTSANTDGSGATQASSIQANQTAGFSIVTGKYFDGSLAHGLSQTPEFIIYKEISPNNNNWFVWHKDLTSVNYYLTLNLTNAQTNYSSNLWGSITSTTFAKNLTTINNRDAIAYCWHSVPGYSHIGSYTGNANADGPYIFTGFKPKFLMIKRISSTGKWLVMDRERNVNNTTNKNYVRWESNAVESTVQCDFLASGFKLRMTSTDINNGTHIYMAFAEHPIHDGTSLATSI